MSDRFYPSLDDADGGVHTDPADQLQRLVAFIFVNPGDTSETHEAHMGSLGILQMKYGETPGVLAQECERMLQKRVDDALDAGRYEVTVTYEDVSDAEYKLVLLVTDIVTGNNVIADNAVIQKVTGES